MTRTETDYLRATRAFLLAGAALLAEQLGASEPASAGVHQPIDLSHFDPNWKDAAGHLTKDGQAAILFAYDQFMAQSEVAKLFQISKKAAHNWHEKWKRARKA